LIASALVVRTRAGWDLTVEGDEDAALYNDRDPLMNVVALSAGDFNGDGLGDLAVALSYPSGLGGSEIDLFLGQDRSGVVVFSEAADARLISAKPIPGASSILLTDLDGDGFDDLAAGFYRDEAVGIWRGGPAVGNRGEPDLLLTATGAAAGFFGRSLGAGDVDGDGRRDLVIGAYSSGRVHVFRGRSSLPQGALAIAADPATFRIIGKTWPTPFGPMGNHLGAMVRVADVNRDGRDDLVLSAPNASPGGVYYAGEVVVLFGRASFPSVWDIASVPADRTIDGAAPSSKLTALGAGDLNGDGFTDILVSTGVTSPTPFFLDGAALDVVGSSATLFGSGLSPLPVAFSSTTLDLVGVDMAGDFDGDGRPDLVFPSAHHDGFGGCDGVLSSDWSGRSLTAVSTPSFSARLGATSLPRVLRDLNGDGVDDLAFYVRFSGARRPSVSWGSLNLIYGDRPLADPTVRVQERAPASPRVHLSLAVGGSPSEMKLSGDLDDAVRDRWVPFRSEAYVRLTSGTGDKSVRAVFRNRYGRESGVAHDVVSLGDTALGLSVVTNRVRAGAQSALVDCSSLSGGRLRARVWDAGGRSVATLLDADVAAGTTVLTWDGRNAAGRAVSPGFYVLSVDWNGGRDVRNLIVE
jgi:hypothetical protein